MRKIQWSDRYEKIDISAAVSRCLLGGTATGSGERLGNVPLAQVQQAASQGDVDAQFSLGMRYEDDQGGGQDEHKAVTWYRAAAEQGFAAAQFHLGVMYTKGQGVAQDNSQAMAWYRKAAEQGQVFAQFNLGMMYFNGQGVAKDYSQAVAWS
ncbi:tetratricopeptide repeat protein, partial [Aeromonas caviae]|uniref:tetratricopeptide repeat protein n=1 Tax=Aeromonas caviae TaxID=648 RepID=UPI003EC6CBAB